MKYEFQYKEFKSGRRKPVATFEEDVYRVLDTFFTVDVAAFPEEVCALFQEVLREEEQNENASDKKAEATFSVCGIEITKDDTYVYDQFQEEEAEQETGCHIETATLYSILLAWIEFLATKEV